MDPGTVSRLETAALIAIVVAGVAVRLGFLSRPMQLDEAYTYNEYASRPFLDGVSRYTLPNNHLLNTWLVHASTLAFGNQRWAVRLPAFLAGIGLIPATFAMVTRLRDRARGLFAAALVASSEPLIDYSTNARGYTLVALITVLLVILALRIRESGGRAVDWLGFTILPALGFFAIPIMLYPFGGVGLWLVLSSRRPRSVVGPSRAVRLDRLLVSLIFAAALTVVLYLPALARMGMTAVAANSYVAPRPLGAVVAALPGSLAGAWLQWNRDIPRAVVTAFTLAWAASLVRQVSARRGLDGPTGLLLMVLVWGVLAALVQRVVPYDRVWLFAVPLYAACLAEGLSWACDWLQDASSVRLAVLRPGLAVLLCLALAVVVARGEALAPKNWGTLHHADAMARLLGPLLGADDAVVAMTPCDAPLTYEFLRHRIPVAYLYDYRIARARRLFVAINRPGQDLDVVLKNSKVPTSEFSAPRLLRDFGESALYEMERR